MLVRGVGYTYMVNERYLLLLFNWEKCVGWAGGKRIHHVDQRHVGLIVGEDLGGAPVEGAGEIQVIGDGRVAARGLGHVAGAGATARNYRNLE